jgi:hypothetical protein
MEQPNGAALIKKRSAEKAKRIAELDKQGYSQRQIARMMKFKSHRSVAYFLAKGRRAKARI